MLSQEDKSLCEHFSGNMKLIFAVFFLVTVGCVSLYFECGVVLFEVAQI